MRELQQLPQLQDVSSDWQDDAAVAYVNVNRDAASRLGLTMSAIDNALYNAFGQRLVSTVYTQSNQYRVVLVQQTAHTTGIGALNEVHIKNSDGNSVPLNAVAALEERRGPQALNRIDQFPATTISFNVPPGYSLGEAVQAITAAERQLQMPTDIVTHFQGSALAFQAALSSTVWLIVAAIVAMYIVLGVLYESFINPITILSTLPTVGVGALLADVVE